MLTIATNSGAFQYHRYEHLRISRQPKFEPAVVKVGDLIDGLAIDLLPCDRIKPAKHEWLTVQAVSWNAAWDRQNEAERAERKAEREAEIAQQEQDAACMEENRMVALAKKLLERGLVKL